MNSTTDTKNRLPKTLMEAVRYFSDPDVCVNFVASLRWENGPVCPDCGGTEHSFLKTRRLWKCKNRECHRQFSVKVGTIFEDSPIPLDKWLCAIWLIANSKNGISSYELGRSIGISQKSAWHVLHRVRLAMKVGNFDQLAGEVEADETFIGGKAKNMHADKRREKIKHAGGGWDKKMVIGALQRADGNRRSRARASVAIRQDHETIQYATQLHVKEGSKLYTDAHGAYAVLGDRYDHESIDHVSAYVRGKVHTNGIENFWSLLKRGLHGTYVSVDAKHLWRYVDERVFTFNERDRNDLGRFVTVLAAVSGRRLTWAELTS